MAKILSPTKRESGEEMNLCRQIRGCPASFYMKCVAYKERKNCWEVVGKPCCKRNNFNRCKKCPIYQAYLERKV